MLAFTAAQCTTFLTDNPQMGISADQRTDLATEGFVTELDFLHFDHNALKLRVIIYSSPLIQHGGIIIVHIFQ